jgi:hypothetical protein
MNSWTWLAFQAMKALSCSRVLSDIYEMIRICIYMDTLHVAFTYITNEITRDTLESV